MILVESISALVVCLFYIIFIMFCLAHKWSASHAFSWMCPFVLYRMNCMVSRSLQKGYRSGKHVSGCNLFNAFVCFIVIAIAVSAGFFFHMYRCVFLFLPLGLNRSRRRTPLISEWNEQHTLLGFIEEAWLMLFIFSTFSLECCFRILSKGYSS